MLVFNTVHNKFDILMDKMFPRNSRKFESHENYYPYGTGISRESFVGYLNISA